MASLLCPGPDNSVCVRERRRGQGKTVIPLAKECFSGEEFYSSQHRGMTVSDTSAPFHRHTHTIREGQVADHVSMSIQNNCI